MKALFVIGRVIFGGFFLYNGINHFRQREGMTQYAGAKGLPAADKAVLASGALLATAGASIILGARPKLGALGVIGFLSLASPMMHDFWNAADAQQGQNDMIHFSKNMALLGAAMAFLGVEEWPVSLDI